MIAEIENPNLVLTNHDLCVFTYDASKVDVQYAGMRHTETDSEVARAKSPKDIARYPNIASGPYAAFASRLRASWTDKSAREHVAELDLASIFKTHTIGAGVSNIDHSNPFVGGHPTIIVEINNRSLSVMLFAHFRVKSDAAGSTKQTYSTVYTRDF